MTKKLLFQKLFCVVLRVRPSDQTVDKIQLFSTMSVAITEVKSSVFECFIVVSSPLRVSVLFSFGGVEVFL